MDKHKRIMRSFPNENKKIYVLVTVDVEAHRGCNPVEEWIYGRYKGEEYGISKIMDICDQCGVKSTFFIDVPEVWSWGQSVIQEVGRKILERGHDLQLHVHPDHITKEPRLFLWEYNYREQKEIIKKSVQEFEILWGRRPIAFRAGKYGANYDTLDLLSEIGVKTDFSMHYNNRWCGLNGPPLTINRLKRYKDIVEFPVTVFKSFDFFGIQRFDSISMDGTYLYEFEKIFQEIVSNKKPTVVVLMLHSFSFVKRNRDGNLTGINRQALIRVEKMLKYLAIQKDLKLVRISDMENELHVNNEFIFRNGDYIPIIKSKLLQYFFTLNRAKRLFGKNKKATIFVSMNIGAMIALAGVIAYALFHT